MADRKWKGAKPHGDTAATGAGRTPAAKQPEAVSAARRAAFQVLREVGAGRGHSDELLHATGRGAALEGLSEADRNLTMALVMGVLRWQIALDTRLRSFFTRPDSVIVDEVMVALRLGAFQLLHMDRIPPHAALSQSVALVRAAGQEYATGMTNAVLRKIAAGPKTMASKIFETIPAMADRLGHPAWLAERWADSYGRDAARAICESDQAEPEIVGILAEMKGLANMDEGSRLVAEIAAESVSDKDPETLEVWDCCAAPGGKTAVLAARLGTASLLASDVSVHRVRTLEERLGAAAAGAGLGGRVRCLVADATRLPMEEGSFDLILCDVPCSGTGTLRRNPEIRLRLGQAEILRQAARQMTLLKAAMERVRSGGRLVYSTCSLEPEECEQVVEAVLKQTGAGWERIGVDGLLEALRERGIVRGELRDAVKEGALRTLPGVHPVEGFYAVVLSRS